MTGKNMTHDVVRELAFIASQARLTQLPSMIAFADDFCESTSRSCTSSLLNSMQHALHRLQQFQPHHKIVRCKLNSEIPTELVGFLTPEEYRELLAPLRSLVAETDYTRLRLYSGLISGLATGVAMTAACVFLPGIGPVAITAITLASAASAATASVVPFWRGEVFRKLEKTVNEVNAKLKCQVSLDDPYFTNHLSLGSSIKNVTAIEWIVSSAP